MKKLFLALISLALGATVATAQSPALQVAALTASVEADASLTALCPDLCKFNNGDQITVNGKAYALKVNKKGKTSLMVDINSSGTYNGVWPADCSSLDKGKGSNFRLLPVQLYKEGGFDRVYMPLRGVANAKNNITFKPMCGVLRLKVSGNAAVNCIKLEDNSGAYMTGYYDLYSDNATLVRRPKTAAGVYFTALDCSNNGQGVALSAEGTDFYFVLPTTSFSKGLKVTITDRSHHTMTIDTKPFTIEQGAITEVEAIAYKPAADQLFSEKFDNFVWGGDRMGGKNCKGYSPAPAKKMMEGVATGVERPIYLVTYEVAGTKYLQTDFKKSLASEAAFSSAYLENRNIAEWPMMFRAQEFQGYIGVGVHNDTRGIVRTPAMKDIQGIAEIEVTFKYSPQARATSNVQFTAFNAGVIKELWIDGVRRTLDHDNYPFVNSNIDRVTLKNSGVRMSYNDQENKQWFEVKAIVSGATSETAFGWTSESSQPKQVNGFFLDDIEVKLLSSVPRERILRIMDYNIQNGMWADQHNNYDNFVKWMNEQDIDIAVFCEASTIYIDKTGDKQVNEKRYLPYKGQPYKRGETEHLVPTGWIELAARFGHNYVAVGAHQDNYPVVITSKYPIKFTQRLGGEGISHGGIHSQVEVDGKVINLVGFHTWPQGFEMGMKRGTPEAIESMRNHGGHKTRKDEFQAFMERSILNPKFADEQYWIITGDMNCVTPLDDQHYKFGYEHPRYWGQRYMLENVPQVTDLIKAYNCPDKRDVLVSSTQGGGRIDLMYGSEPMLKSMIKAKSPQVGFTTGKPTGISNFYSQSSDHLPVIIDFIWR